MNIFEPLPEGFMLKRVVIRNNIGELVPPETLVGSLVMYHINANKLQNEDNVILFN
jgi:hypothetical protein